MKYLKNINSVLKNPENFQFQEFSSTFSFEKLCERSGIDYDSIFSVIEGIETKILERGDEALKYFTKKFDGVDVKDFLISKEVIDSSDQLVSKELQEAILQASENIEKFHVHQKRNIFPKIETTKGVQCWQEFRSIDSVGLYIPGGTAPLFSTFLMLAIPAKIAGCKKIVVTTPPQKDGTLHPAVLFTAKILGISEIYTIGGAQAIFALSYGTETIPKVEKIFGPGNAFVTAAKMKISRRTAIDMPAGPSEVLVIADEFSNPTFIASDLLSQAEHGGDSQSVLVTTSEEIARETLKAIEMQLKQLTRSEIAKKSLESSFIVVSQKLIDCIDVSNKYAPEHLILHIKDWKRYLPHIINAGSVFCGEFTPESAGDYASGTNHTLPTSGFAKSFSGVSVESFGKWITFQHITKEGIENLGDTIEVMAREEGLDAHKNAVVIRRK